jgi:hypothetical protein
MMFKLIPFVLMFVALSPMLKADDDTIELGHLFDESLTTWYEISYRCSELVPYFYELGEQDSLSYILQYWEQEAYTLEPIRRVWTLNQIAQNSFESELVTSTTVDDFVEYLVTLEQQNDDSLHWRLELYDTDKKGPKYISGDFNAFTRQLANDLLQFTDLSDDEYLICLFYAHEFDEFWRLIKSDEARYTTLAKRIKIFRKEQQTGFMHFGFFLGYYSPRKSFLTFGEKANIGGTIGVDLERLNLDFTLLFQFLNSEKNYNIYHQDELFETNHYFRFYIGAEPAFRLYDWKHAQVHLLSGIGADIVEVVSESDNPFAEEPITIAGLNLNVGIGFQHIVKKGFPLSIQYQLRYEFAGYDTDGGTDLSGGEAVSFRLGFSWDENKRKHEFKKYFD